MMILPVVQKFRLDKLRTLCDKSLVCGLQTEKEVPFTSILEHLETAENFRLDRLKGYCIQQCSFYTDKSSRELLSSSGVSADVKIIVLNQMFETLGDTYDSSLRQLRYDMDERCRAIEKRRDEFMETTDEWKNALTEKVNNFIEGSQSSHTEFLDKEKIKQSLKAVYKEFDEKLMLQLNTLSKQVDFMIEQETRTDADSNQLRDLKDISDLENAGVAEKSDNSRESNPQNDLLEAFNQTNETLAQIKAEIPRKIQARLHSCAVGESLDSAIKENYQLLERMKQMSIELNEQSQLVSGAEIKVQRALLALETTDAELQRHVKRDRELNTWLRSGKPDADMSAPCSCVSHARRKYMLDN